MKKSLSLALALLFLICFVGCKSGEAVSNDSKITEATQEQITTATQTNSEDSTIIAPLPISIDIANLKDCMVAISFEKGDFYKEENGAVMMQVTVFVYDFYDMQSVALMQAGDIILRNGKEVQISSVERNQNGAVLINGGLDNGGFELYAEEDDTVYYERGYSDTKSYYELGKATLPVSNDFIYNDASDLDQEAKIFTANDFLQDSSVIDYHFNANNTTIRIENGFVVEMTRIYTP